MEFKILNTQEHNLYYDELFKMLIAGDEEFVPPLSARSSTTQTNLASSEKSESGILAYFEEMKKQRIMIATDECGIVAFVSFKENYTNAVITPENLPNIYLSTLIVKPEGRGMGLTSQMYKILFEKYRHFNIFTRTWSTNTAHIKILSKFNFETLFTIKNDRGNGIDTVYFVKRTHS